MSIMDKTRTSPTTSPTSTEILKTLREGRKLDDLLKTASRQEVIDYIAAMAALTEVAGAEAEKGKAWLRGEAAKVFEETKSAPVIFASALGPIKVADLGRRTFSAVKGLLTEGKGKISTAIYSLLFEEVTTVKVRDGYAEAVQRLPAADQVVISSWVEAKTVTPKVTFAALPTT